MHKRADLCFGVFLKAKEAPLLGSTHIHSSQSSIAAVPYMLPARYLPHKRAVAQSKSGCFFKIKRESDTFFPTVLHSVPHKLKVTRAIRHARECPGTVGSHEPFAVWPVMTRLMAVAINRAHICLSAHVNIWHLSFVFFFL